MEFDPFSALLTLEWVDHWFFLYITRTRRVEHFFQPLPLEVKYLTVICLQEVQVVVCFLPSRCTSNSVPHLWHLR